MNKYIIFAVAALALFVILILITVLRIRKRKKFLPAGIFCVIGLLLSGAAAAVFGYSSQYYHAAPSAAVYLESSGTVSVSRIGEGWFFDGAGTDDAIVFFQGGKVESSAYAPLLREIADNGIDCFLIDSPLNIPFLGIGSAESIIGGYSYSHLYLAGHSLGGVTASAYCAKHSEQCEGLILLAAFPMSPIEDNIGVLSVYGSNDGCLDTQEYAAAKTNMPQRFEEFVIEGGNHAQFGDYGEQKGDGKATVTPEEQRSFTVEKICDFIRREEQ